MAEFIQNGGTNGGQFAKYFSAKLSVWEISTDTNANSSRVGYKLELISGNSGRFSDLEANYTVCIDSQGSPQYPATGTGRYSSQNHNSSQVICEGTVTVYHNEDGRKNIGCWASLDFQNHSYSPGDFNVSGYMDLSNIERAPDFNGHRLESTSLESVKIAYNSNKNLIAAESSLNGGPWKPLRIIIGNWNQANNTVVYEIDNLVANTNYNIQTRISNIANVWKNSNILNFKTKDYIRISSVSNVNFGEGITINFRNLENGTGKLIVKIDNVEICTRDNLTDKYILAFTKEELSKIAKMAKEETIEITYIVTTNNKYSYSTKGILTLKSNVYLKKGGTWKRAKMRKKKGSWKFVKVFIKINGRWRNTK